MFSWLATTPGKPSLECEPLEKCIMDSNTFNSGFFSRNLTTCPIILKKQNTESDTINLTKPIFCDIKFLHQFQKSLESKHCYFLLVRMQQLNVYTK